MVHEVKCHGGSIVPVSRRLGVLPPPGLNCKRLAVTRGYQQMPTDAPDLGQTGHVPCYPRFRDGGTADGTFPAPNRSPRTVQTQAKKPERLGRHGTPNKQPTNENPPGTLLTPVRNPSPGLLRFLNCPTPLCLRPLTHSATVHFWLEGERGETPCTHEPSHTLRPRTPRGEVLYFFLLLHLIHILAAPLSKSNPYRRANLKIISANP